TTSSPATSSSATTSRKSPRRCNSRSPVPPAADPGTHVCPARLRRIRNHRSHNEEVMFVGVMKLSFHLPGARSLKDKRQVVRSFRDRVRARLDVSIAEVEHMDL